MATKRLHTDQVVLTFLSYPDLRTIRDQSGKPQSSRRAPRSSRIRVLSGLSISVSFERMSITAIVDAGRITLPADVNWPSGTVVRIEPVEDAPLLCEIGKDFDG